MKSSLIAVTALMAGGLAFAAPNVSGAADSKIFNMRSAQRTCLHEAAGRVTLNALGIVEEMHVEVSGLPKNTDFDVFVIQVPTAPFGLSWYQGDIETSSEGNGVADF